MTVAARPPRAGVFAAVSRWSDDPRRSLVIGAAGAVIGLLLAGFGLFTAKGTAVRGVPPEDAAVVNQKPILSSDLAIQVQSTLNKPITEASPAARRQVLDTMISEELMVQRGLELDQPEIDPDVRAALVAAVQAQVTVDATSRTPTEAELRAFYDRRKASYASMGEMTVRDLFTPDRSDAGQAVARQAVDALRRGTDPASLIGPGKLKDSARTNGEELYFAAKLHLGDALFARAASLGDGQVSDPVLDADGWHVLVMAHNDRPRPRTFDQARSQVYSDYKEDLTERLRQGEARYLRSRGDIAIAQPYR